jgi:8-amino-7-oxononanoate synthase
MLDFTSALYLGLRHASGSLAAWDALTGGRPATLVETDGAAAVAQRAARLTGCEAGLLLPSTLHLFFDLFSSLPRGSTCYVDAGVYPVARWGVEHAASRGHRVRTFAHFDAAHLEHLLARDARAGFHPIVVTDGFCPGCGLRAPLNSLLAGLRRYEGTLVIDDTQALGIFGERCDAPATALHAPAFGCGGGGSLRACGANGPDIVLASSLAKAFGVPVAMLAGSREFVAHFARHSATRMHCSPPSVAVVRAAERALDVNVARGDALRARLARHVRHFREIAGSACSSIRGNLFPVQTLGCGGAVGEDAVRLHHALATAGVRTVLQSPRDPRVSFLFSSSHSEADVEHAALTLQRCLSDGRRRRSGGLP